MGEFDAILKCTYGGITVPMQLEDWSYDSKVIDDGRSRTLSISGRGWIEAATWADLATAAEAVAAEMELSGRDFKVWEGNVIARQILAAWCVDNGPHVDFQFEVGMTGPAGVKFFTFTVTGKAQGDEDEQFRERITYRPDGLRTITRIGYVSGTAVATFDALQVAPFMAAYPTTNWVHSREVERNFAGDRLDYTLSAVELRTPLPGEPITVEGTGRITTDRSEQMRLTKTWEFDLLVNGDYVAVLDLIRAEVAAGGTVVILRESVAVTRFSETRINASFVTLAGGNGNRLMDWSQRFRIVRGDEPVWGEHRYPGPDPVLVLEPKGVRRLVQTGSAVGAGGYPVPPDALFPGALLAAPEIEHAFLNEIERQTSWTYVMAIDADPDVALLNRPATPTFLGLPPPPP